MPDFGKSYIKAIMRHAPQWLFPRFVCLYFLYLYVNFLSKSSSKGPKVIKVQTTPWLEVLEEEEVEAEEVEVVVEEEA